jgi:hypothetical protein
LASAAAVLLRVLAVSRFDEETALAVLSSSDPAALIIGTVGRLLPWAAPTVLTWVYIYRREVFGGDLPVALTLGLALFGLILLLTPTIQLLLSAAAVALTLIVYRIFFRQRIQRGPPSAVATARLWIVALFIGLNVPYLIAFPDPWLPPEVVTINGQAVYGYVLGSSGGWASILLDHERRVERVRDDTISGRTVCQQTSAEDLLAQSPLALLRRITSGTDKDVHCPVPPP